MNRYVEDQVKQCLFWKQQLESLTYQNRLLDSEKRSLRNDYEELLEKTKHDMGIILKLKDSKKKLADETEEYFTTNRDLTTLNFVNTNLRSDKLSLENKKSELLDSMKKNTTNMQKVNETHKYIQIRMEKENKRGERNSKRYTEELEKLSRILNTDEDVFEQFKRNLKDHEQSITDLESFLDIGLRGYLGLDSNEEKEVSSKNLRENKSETETEDETTIDKIEILINDETVSDHTTPAEEKIREQWRKNKIILQLTEKENSHLLKSYDHLHNVMQEMDERYLEMTNCLNLKETELHRYRAEAEYLYNAVLQKRKKFVFPPNDDRTELRIRIQTQIKEMEATRKLLSLSFSHMNINLQLHMEFTDDMKEFYTRLIEQIETELKSSMVTEEESISNRSENV